MFLWVGYVKIINVHLKFSFLPKLSRKENRSTSMNCVRYTGKSKSKAGLIRSLISKTLGYAKHLT